MRLVRYADDFVLTFESRGDAQRMQAALGARLAEFGLGLHADKTRLIELGWRAAELLRFPLASARIVHVWRYP